MSRFSVQNESADSAKRLLLHYMGYALNGGFVEGAAHRGGTQLDQDTRVELSEIVDHIVFAAIEQIARDAKEIPTIPEVALADEALELAHERCGQAHARVMQLEDMRQEIKPDAIQRIVASGGATSASAAEKLVEKLDDEYMAHRCVQYEAEIERWRALGQVQAAKLRAALAGGRDG